ncbi:hypothetical protein [Algoriphagus persicinus]|nr:hypothetical protein [Algoriphagus sp. E1-3-M2]MEB2786943.1 hypothetical protein [Algoriphagus sp. E1-3-M2]
MDSPDLKAFPEKRKSDMKSSKSQASHTGMIIYHARFHVTNKNQL